MTTHLQETVDQWAEDVDASGVYRGDAGLEPCPHCGVIPYDVHKSGSAFFIGADHKPDCFLADFKRTEAEAITAWNTRTQPKVKALVWTIEADGTLVTDSVVGEYAVYLEPAFGWLCERDGHDDNWVKYPAPDCGFEHPDDAQEAVQSDHDSRILSALEGDAS